MFICNPFYPFGGSKVGGGGDATAPENAYIQPPQAWADNIQRCIGTQSYSIDLAGKNITFINPSLGAQINAMSSYTVNSAGWGISNNRISTNNIDNILASAVSSAWSYFVFDSSGQTPPAPPTPDQDYSPGSFKITVPANYATYVGSSTVDIYSPATDTFLTLVLNPSIPLSSSSFTMGEFNIGILDVPTIAQIATKTASLINLVVASVFSASDNGDGSIVVTTASLYGALDYGSSDEAWVPAAFFASGQDFIPNGDLTALVSGYGWTITTD